MKLFNRSLSFSLVLMFVSQMVLMPMASAATTTRREERIAKREVNAEAKFFKRFDKKFDRFAVDVEETVGEYTDFELNEMYEEMIIWLEQHGNYEMSRAMIVQHNKGKGSVRAILLQMVTEEARTQAKASLKAAIVKAGGFNQFLKLAKVEKRANLDIKCRAKKIASYILLAPVTLVGLSLGAGALGALAGGVVTGVVLAELGIFIVADGFAFPWFVENMAVGCYNQYDHDGFADY